MAENKSKGIFVNTKNRPDLAAVVAELKQETGIVLSADLVYQALRRWLRELRRPTKGPLRPA